jgi:anaerobic C4-dicarboxylate transporter
MADVGVPGDWLPAVVPELRVLPGSKSPLSMPIIIDILMMSVAAIMLLVTRVNVDDVPRTATLRAGVVAVIGIFGLAWLGDSFIAANKDMSW